MVCNDADIFCSVKEKCSDVEKRVKPFGIHLDSYIFELPPSEYLFSSGAKECQFKMHKCNLPGKNKNMMILGDLFLQNFYSVFNYETKTIGLGVDKHAEGKAKMYKAEQKSR